jgi:serine/threonine protein kinase
MLRGVDAVGSANPFKGAGQGQYNSSGAKTGFAMKGRSGSAVLRGETQVSTGFRMESFVFGFPTADDIVFYEVDRKRDLLGEGADCAYKCRDIATKEQFAVKIYDTKGTAQKRQIVNDLKAKQSIGDHPQIVRYHAVVETEEQIFVLMELIPGKDLFSHIVESNGLTEKRAAYIFYQLCQALEFCHSHDIIHGDVKPENAMVIDCDSEEPSTKLIEFGFACFLDNEGDEKKAVGDVYSPKEALLGQPSSKAVDSFRLGCTLYVMLMATYPFQRHCRDHDDRAAGRVLKYPKWNTLSSESRDLIEQLCRDRISVVEAQSHPWVVNNYKAPASS